MFSELTPILNQCSNLTLSLTPKANGDLTVVMQTRLKTLAADAPDSAKQLYAALAMPLVVTANVAQLDGEFVTMLSEYCQQFEQSQTALEQSLERIKESNKSARQTASKTPAATKKTALTDDKPIAPIEETPKPVAASVTTQSNPPSLF